MTLEQEVREDLGRIKHMVKGLRESAGRPGLYAMVLVTMLYTCGTNKRVTDMEKKLDTLQQVTLQQAEVPTQYGYGK